VTTKTTKKEAKPTARKSTTKLPRHQIAAIKIGRLVSRTAKLAARYSRYGSTLTDSLLTAHSALQAGVEYLATLPDDFQLPAAKKNGKTEPKAEKA